MGLNDILIIDDEKIIRDSLYLTLKRENYNFHFADNGKDGLTLIKSITPILVILDIRMPNMDGIQFLEHLKPKLSDPYAIIVLTGHGTNQDVKKAYELGVSNFIRKPFNVIELIGLVKSLVSMKRNELEIRRVNELLEQKQHELIHSGRLALMGEVTSTFAHQIKQPLMLQKLTLENLQMEIEEGKYNKNSLITQIEECKTDLEKLQTMIDHILNIGYYDERNYERFDFIESIKSIKNLIEYYLQKRGSSLKLDLPQNLPKLYGIKNQIEQVILNLVINSAEAMKNTDKDKIVTIGASYDENNFYINITDLGCGIEKEIRSKIFTPFFTSKPKGQGTGLGLPIAKAIIEQHHGTIQLDEEYSNGARFLITLPKK